MLYSLGLVPCDFLLFPKVTMTMKEKCFESVPDLEAAVTAQAKTLRKEDLQSCYRAAAGGTGQGLAK